MPARTLSVDTPEAADVASGVLAQGGVILYPTDTIYGLGADALSNDAVDQIYAIKGRREDKPIHAIVADLEMADKYAFVTDEGRKLVAAFGGAVSVIFKKRAGVSIGIARDIDTFGVRVSDDQFCHALAVQFGKPYTATSANRAGMPTGNSVSEILAQLGDSGKRISLAVDGGELPRREPSTVVDLSSDKPTILREGAVSASQVFEVLR